MEHLASQPVVRELSERTVFFPPHADIVTAGDLQFRSKDPSVQPALEKFVQATMETSPAADAPPACRWVTACYGALVTRISQVMAGKFAPQHARGLKPKDIVVRAAVAQTQ